jgi:putative FmdB family regulatory protein
MPTYSYIHTKVNSIETIDSINKCEYTEEVFDVVQSIKDDALSLCPTCNEPVKRIITSAPGYKLNGTGFTPKFHS